MGLDEFKAKVARREVEQENSVTATREPTDKERGFVTKLEASKAGTEQSGSNLRIATQTNTPSQATAAYQYSKKNRVNISLANEASKIPEMSRVFPSDLARQSPAIQKYSSRRLNDAEVSQDDWDNLIEVERAVNNVVPGYVGVDGEIPTDVEGVPLWKSFDAPEETRNMSLVEKSKRAFDIGRHNLTLGRMRFNQIFGDETPESDAAIDTFKKRIPASVEGDNIIEDAAIAASSMTPLVVESFKTSQEEGLAGAIGAGSAVAIAGQVPPLTVLPEEVITVPAASALGYAAGTTFGAGKNIYIQETGLMYDELLDIRDENGQPIDKTVLKTAALGYGGISTIFEMIGLKYIVKTIPGGRKLLGKLTKEPVKKILKSPTVRKALLRIGKRWLKSTTAEGTTEGMQEAAAIIAVELSKYYAKNKEGSYFLPFNWENAFRRVGGATYQGTLGGGVFGAPGSVAGAVKIPFDVNRGKKFTETMKKTKEAVDKTQTATMSTDHAERFVEATELQKESNIVPDDTLFQVDGIDEILRKVDINPREVRKAITSGQDIPVSTAKILAQLTKDESDLLLSYVQPAPDGYTEKQITEKEPQEDAEQLKEDYGDLLADDLEFGKELDRIKGEIIKANFTSEMAEANTALVERFSNSLALQGADRTAFLKSLEFKRTPFLERAMGKAKTLFQAPTETDFELSQNIASIQTRIDKLDETTPEGSALVTKLEKQRVALSEQLQERASLGFETLLQAQKGRDPKAAFDVIDDKVLIQLFERADPSSIPHELGHTFLREMTLIEDTEGITDQFKTDMNAIRTWLGAEKDAGYTREQQEQFARGWEQWLREGKAPNAQLDTVFARFKRWLEEVYKRARSLDVKLTPDIKAVFNRMLDADTETKTAAAVHNMIEPTTDRMNELGVPDAEQSDLKRLVRKAIEKANNALFRARQRAVRDNKARFERESEQEIKAEDSQGRPFGVYEMIDDIKENNLQFSRSEYNEAIGNPNGYKFLPAKNITSTKETALSLEDTAFAYGFDSADIMVEALATTLPLDTAIQNRVNQKNQVLEDTFKSEDYLAEVKEYTEYIQRWTDHLRNEQARATRAEVTGRPRKKITTEQMKAYAQSQIDEMSVRNAQRTDRFLAAMKRAAVAMRKAEKAKDYAKAIRESEKMLLNKEMAGISVRNKRAVTSFVNRAKKFRKLGAPQSVSLRFREGIRKLIERFSILPNVSAQKEGYSIADLQELLKGDEHVGEFFASEFLLPQRPEDARIRDYRNISMLELKELDNMIKFLTKMGRDEQTGLLSDGQTTLDDVVQENVEDMNTIKPQEVHDRFSIWRKTTAISRSFFANLLGLPYITKALGGYQALKGKLSSLEQQITERLKDIEDARLKRTDTNNQEIQEAVTVIGNAQRRMIKNAKGQKLFDSGVPVPEIIQDNGSQLNYWTPEQIMSLAFNRGNQSNINALLQGFQGLTLGQVDTLLNKYLTREDMNAVQSILDQMETLFPETDRVHVKMKGFHMGKVPAQAWTFKGKKYQGGYYPLNYDRVLSDQIDTMKQKEDLFESEQAKFTVPYAASNHTIQRTDSGHALPVDLKLIYVYKHFDHAIRYITHAETIRDIDRITKNKEWRDAAIKALGKDVYDQIRPSLKQIANPHIRGVDIPGKRAINYLRGVATAANLALNTMVAMKQVFSTPSAIHDMGLGDGGGFKAYMRGMGHVLASPAVAYNTMLEMSPYMKERITSWERDLLRPKFNRMTPAQREVAFGNRHVTWSDVVNLGFFEIKAMDTATVMPIWWGAYQDKLNDNSSNEKEAIRHADNIVRDTQPSATALDLSAWFREGGFFGLFNLHQTFTVGKYGQRQRTYFRAWNYGKGSISTVDYAWFNFMDAFIPLISINIMVAFLKGGDLAGDEDEWYEIAEKTVMSWLLMGIPIASSMYDAITKGWRDPLEVPGARQVKRTARTIGHLGQGTSNIITGESLSDREKQQLYWGMADMVSDFSRVPVSKVSKKALEGDGFREKIFGKKFKKRR